MRTMPTGLLFLCMLGLAAAIYPLSVEAKIDYISKEELKAKLCSPDVLLLDVRAYKDWKKSKIKIKCAIRVDPNDVASLIDTIPKDKEIVFYCCA